MVRGAGGASVCRSSNGGTDMGPAERCGSCLLRRDKVPSSRCLGAHPAQSPQEMQHTPEGFPSQLRTGVPVPSEHSPEASLCGVWEPNAIGAPRSSGLLELQSVS